MAYSLCNSVNSMADFIRMKRLKPSLKMAMYSMTEEQLKEAWNIWYEKQWNGEISPSAWEEFFEVYIEMMSRIAFDKTA